MTVKGLAEDTSHVDSEAFTYKQLTPPTARTTHVSWNEGSPFTPTVTLLLGAITTCSWRSSVPQEVVQWKIVTVALVSLLIVTSAVAG